MLENIPVCRILNTHVWPQINSEDEDFTIKDIPSLQIASVKCLFQKYKMMNVFQKYSEDNIVNGFVDIVKYANRYFDVDSHHLYSYTVN